MTVRSSRSSIRRSRLGVPCGERRRRRPIARALRPTDILRVGALGLRTRRLRTGLSTLGIAIGIAAMVGVLGLSASSREELQTRIRRARHEPVGGAGRAGLRPRHPDTSRRRREDGAAESAPVTAVSSIATVDATRATHRCDLRRASTAASPCSPPTKDLLTTLKASLADGEWLDDATSTYPAVVLGCGRCTEVGHRQRCRRTPCADRRRLVRGDRNPQARCCSRRARPRRDHRHRRGTRRTSSSADIPPERIYVRTQEGAIDDVRAVLPPTVNPETPEEVEATRPSDAFAAEDAASTAFTSLFLGLGAVALLVGGDRHRQRDGDRGDRTAQRDRLAPGTRCDQGPHPPAVPDRGDHARRCRRCRRCCARRCRDCHLRVDQALGGRRTADRDRRWRGRCIRHRRDRRPLPGGSSCSSATDRSAARQLRWRHPRNAAVAGRSRQGRGLRLVGGAAAAVALRNPKQQQHGDAIDLQDCRSHHRRSDDDREDRRHRSAVDDLPVLHRIEGQTSSSAVATSTPTRPGRSDDTRHPDAGSRSQPATQPSGTVVPADAPDCSSTTVPATSPEPTTTTPTARHRADTTAPDGRLPTRTTPLSDTATTRPCTRRHVRCDGHEHIGSRSDTTRPRPGASTTTGRGSGGARTGSGGGASRSAGGTNSSNASTARVTKRSHRSSRRTQQSIKATCSTRWTASRSSRSTALCRHGARCRRRRTMDRHRPTESKFGCDGVRPGAEGHGRQHFDSATRTMVKAWQQGSASSRRDRSARVGRVPANRDDCQRGGSSGGRHRRRRRHRTDAGGSTQQVVVDVPAGDESKVVPGLAVSIGDVQGTVTRFGRRTNGAVVVEALIVPGNTDRERDQRDRGEGHPHIAERLRSTDRPGGSTGLATRRYLRRRGEGRRRTTTWLTVDLLGVSGGNVALRGDGLTEGTTLLLPV